MSKFTKLIKNPNRFFYDYFSKRIGKDKVKIQSHKSEYLMPPGYKFDEKIHPWVQISKKFSLRTGAITGHADQSLLADSTILLDLILFSMWIAYGFKSNFKIYTLGGGFETLVSGNELLNPRKAEWIYSKIFSKPDFVIEFIGEFDNNFAAHFFVYDVDSEGFILIRSNLAFIKRTTIDGFKKIYPEIIDNFGSYEFRTPSQVDIVFTWVNKDDLYWQKMWNETFPEQGFDADRYSSRDEIRYSLRAICKYLPWFHRVHIVSNCNRPDWLKSHSKLNWVKHEEIFPDLSVLPTFNSHAIEACLHRIPMLSENFIYFNDDVFVNNPCYFSDFFDVQGRTVAHFEPYGMAHELNIHQSAPDYMEAAINSQKLLNQIFPNFSAHRLHKHTPHVLNKKILQEIEDSFFKQIDVTRGNRLRAKNDINLTSFLYHHYAIAKGKAVSRDFSSIIIRPNNIRNFINSVTKKYKFLCANDGNGSSENQQYHNYLKQYFTKTFPKTCDFELMKNN